MFNPITYVEADYKGKLIKVKIPLFDYWETRNAQRVKPFWKEADNLDKAMTKEFAKTYKELEKELYTFAGKFGKDGKLTYSKQRVVQLMKLLKPYIDETHASYENKLTQHLISTYDNNFYAGLYELQNGVKVYESFVALDERAVKTAVSFPWSGETFSDRIYNNKQKLVRTLKSEITNSLIRGDSLQQTSKSVAKKLGISVSDATRLTQTETGAVITSSTKKMYKEFGLDQYRYLATLDDRTSSVCQGLDGRVFNVEEMTSGLNAPPMHPRCRSTTVPDFGERTGKRIARNLKSGKTEYVDSDITYKVWYNKYVEENK